jgi:hypothetical protein
LLNNKEEEMPMRGIENKPSFIKTSSRLGLLQTELRAAATPPTPLFSSPGLSSPGLSPILPFSASNSLTFDNESFKNDSDLNDDIHIGQNFSSEEGVRTDSSFCSDHESPEYQHQHQHQHQHQQFLPISPPKGPLISINKRQDVLEESYQNLQTQLQGVKLGSLKGSLPSQVHVLIQSLCENSSELDFICSDISYHKEFFLNEVSKLDGLIQNFLQEDVHEKKNFSMRDEKGSFQIERFPEGNRIILWGVKRKIVEGASCRFKPHNLVFYCDKNFEQVTHYGDIINSTLKKNKDDSLKNKPHFIQMVKLAKNNIGERISFAQLNQGIELNQIVTKREQRERLGIEIINQMISSVFIEFIRFSEIQWDKKEVFTDLKAGNILLSLKNGKFVIKFIDYISNDIADGRNGVIPVSCGKLPIELFMSGNLKEYVEKHPNAPFFDGSIERPNTPLIHPIVAYIQIVVVCLELFLGKYISQSDTKERVEALQNLNMVLMQHSELKENILFRRYYIDACDYVVRASSFFMA